MQFLLLLAVIAGPLQESDPTANDPAWITWRQANESHRMGDLNGDEKSYRAAEAAYREILKKWPDHGCADTTMECLADVLLALKRPKEARDFYLKMNEADAKKPEHRGKPYFRPGLYVKIGMTYEAEAEWAKALENYREGAKMAPGDMGFCGTCVDQKNLLAQTRLARCLDKLGHNDEAMAICREILFTTDAGTGGTSVELCRIAVEISIRTGRFGEFEQELKTAERPKWGGANIKTALDYIRILRLREAGDFEGLFDSVDKVINPNDWYQGRWSPGSPLYVEALECLATLGNPAFEWLAKRAEGDAYHGKNLALTAIAYFRDERALAFIRSDRWKLNYDQEHFRKLLEKIHSGSPRKREYPPVRIQRQSMAMGLTLVLGAAVLVGSVIRHRKSKA
jgi:tetratricopeptide (TPR) repeat protein